MKNQNQKKLILKKMKNQNQKKLMKNSNYIKIY